MKIRILVLAIALLGFSFFPLKAEAVESSASFGVDYMSQYVWRGTQLSDDSFVLQPSVEGTYGPITVNLWANYDTEVQLNTETDLTVSYSRSIDKVSLDVGYIYYSLPGADDTQEIYVSVGYDVLLSPNVTYYQDIEQDTGGGFAVASIGYDLEVAEGIAVSLGASASVNFENSYSMGQNAALEDFTALYNAEFSASVPYALPFDENIVVTPMLAYSFALSDDAKEALESIDADGDSSVLYGGVGISVGF
jgi:uncharacterized protein (TIGR02001 family)